MSNQQLRHFVRTNDEGFLSEKSNEKEFIENGSVKNYRKNFLQDRSDATTVHLNVERDSPWFCIKLQTSSCVPSYLVESYISNYYRPETRSFRKCIGTTFLQLHNQTMDIWTHLITIIIYAFLGYHCFFVFLEEDTHKFFIYGDQDDSLFSFLHLSISLFGPQVYVPSLLDKAMFVTYFLGVFVCFFSSCLFHIFGCHSEDFHFILMKLDQSGIIFVFWTSSIFLNYCCLHCYPDYQLFSFTRVSLLAILVLLVIWKPRKSPSVTVSMISSQRGMLFSAVLMFLSEVINMVFVASITTQWNLLYAFLWTCFAYAVGMMFYLTKFPESKFPGRFDLFFKSHSCWHICITIGAINFYPLILDAFHFYCRSQYDCH